MDQQVVTQYIKLARAAGVSDPVTLGVLMKRLGMEKSGSYMLKTADSKKSLAKLLAKKLRGNKAFTKEVAKEVGALSEEVAKEVGALSKDSKGWISKAIPWAIGPTLGGWLGLNVGSAGKAKAEKERDKAISDLGNHTGFDISSGQVLGGLTGGGLGYLVGPSLMPSLDKPNARIAGGLGGALLGSTLVTLLKDE